MGKRLIIKGADFSSVGIDAVVPQVATPVLSPAGGQYEGSVRVSITCSTPGATIYYTTNGLEPSTSSTVYNGAITLDSVGMTTIKAIAVKNGVRSQMATASYTVVEAGGEPSVVPQSVTINGASTSTTKNVQLTATVGPSGAPSAVTWNVISGSATVSSSGLVTYDDSVSSSGTVVVRATATGYPGVYDEHTIAFDIASEDPVPDSVATPVLTPDHGAPKVTITCATSGATIYYTTDGSVPSASSTQYSAPVDITSACTLMAIAIKSGVSSEVASATYIDRQWKEGYYWSTDGHDNGGNNNGGRNRAFVCTKLPIDVQNYTNLRITVKAGWKVRVFRADSYTVEGDKVVPSGSWNEGDYRGSENEDTNFYISNVGDNSKRYVSLNLCKWGTAGASSFVAYTDEELNFIYAGDICYWGDGGIS